MAMRPGFCRKTLKTLRQDGGGSSSGRSCLSTQCAEPPIQIIIASSDDEVGTSATWKFWDSFLVLRHFHGTSNVGLACPEALNVCASQYPLIWSCKIFPIHCLQLLRCLQKHVLARKPLQD